VTLSSLEIEYTFIVSDNPPALLVEREESTMNVSGYERDLASLTLR
jgi:hypothetical protein